MENASKALIMAGGVLISLLVISLLVFFFNNLRDVQNINLSAEQVQQATEFNKQYDVYARNVYGSELLSIANKVADYNKRESGNKGYTKVILEVEITDANKIDDTYFKGETYTIPNNNTANVLQDRIEAINDKLDEYGKYAEKNNNVYSSKKNSKIRRTIAQLANIRTKEWIMLLGLDEKEDEVKIAEINNKITKYYGYKNLETQMKQTVFKYVDFDYDDNNGRITKMKFKL